MPRRISRCCFPVDGEKSPGSLCVGRGSGRSLRALSRRARTQRTDGIGHVPRTDRWTGCAAQSGQCRIRQRWRSAHRFPAKFNSTRSEQSLPASADTKPTSAPRVWPGHQPVLSWLLTDSDPSGGCGTGRIRPRPISRIGVAESGFVPFTGCTRSATDPGCFHTTLGRNPSFFDRLAESHRR